MQVKTNILKITGILLSMLAAWSVLPSLSAARDSSIQDRVTNKPSDDKTVDQAFKNIKVLNGMPQSQLYPAMRFMATSLGFQCGSCHVIRNGWIEASADDKPEKQTARQMIKMVVEMNKTYFQGNPTVNCYTCHQGHRSPQGAPVL